MVGGDLHESGAARSIGRLGARLHQGIIRPGKRNAVDDDQRTGRPRHVHALPQGKRAEEAGVFLLGEFLYQCADGILALYEEVKGDARLEGGGCLFRRAAGGKQTKRAPAGGHNELVDLIDGFFGQAIAARRG